MTGNSYLHSIVRRPLGGVAAALLFGGFASLLRGVDTNWDLRNYHFYNPWAWLNGRLTFDYAPAQVQSYYSPLLDLPFFALVQAHLPAFAITFLMGFPFGLAVYFFVRIARYATVDFGVDREARVLVPDLPTPALVDMAERAGDYQRPGAGLRHGGVRADRVIA